MSANGTQAATIAPATTAAAATTKREQLREELEDAMSEMLGVEKPNKEKIAIIKVVADYLGNISPPEETPMGSKL